MGSRTSVVMVLFCAALGAGPVLGQSSQGSTERSPLRTAAAREGARLAGQMIVQRAIALDGEATAQNADDVNWERLRAVKVGTRLVVSRRGSPDVKGRMEAVAADRLQLSATDAGMLTLRRDEVLAVYQDHRYTTKQWVGIGALGGAASGLVIGVIADSQSSSELAGLGVRLFPVVGAVYGSVGGLFLGGIANRNPSRLIYRAPLVSSSG